MKTLFRTSSHGVQTRAAAPIALIALVALIALAGCGSGGDGDSAAASTPTATPTEAVVDGALLSEAVAGYEAYVAGQVDLMRARTRVFTDAVRAGDLDAARAAYAPSRAPWERIEPIAALVEEIDEVVDARVDDFAGPDAPDFTGWHRLELLLFERDTTHGATPFANRLDADLATLEAELSEVEITPLVMARGSAELIDEVAQGKITGEEDRYSKTDLFDIAANVEGARRALELLSPALAAADPELLARIQTRFDALEGTLRPLRAAEGWVPYCRADDPYPSDICTTTTVSPETVDALIANANALAEDLALVPGALGLSVDG